MATDSKPLFARSGITSPFGGMTAEIPKLRVPEDTKEILEKEARKAGLNFSEFVRYVLMVRAHGVKAMVSMEQERLRIIAGNGEE